MSQAIEELGRPPGLVGEICEWIDATARKKQPVLSLGASIAFVGALASKRYQAIDGTRPNVYCIGVGPSGCGKEHARTQIRRLADAAGVNNLFGGSEVTSDAAIEMELHRMEGRVFYMWDEIGHMFGAMKNNKASSSAQKIIPLLMKLFTSSGKVYDGKTYASREDARKPLDQPHVCLYGTTVPGRLYEGMDSSEMSDGWLGRVLVFETKEDPRQTRGRAMDMDIPQDLIDKVRAINEHAPDVSDLGDIVGLTACKPTKLAFTPPADDVFDEQDDLFHSMKELARDQKNGYDALWSRGTEIGTKVALILAAGDGAAIIDERHAKYGCELFTALVCAFMTEAQKEVGDNDNERDRKKLLSIIQEYGEHGTTLTKVSRRTQTMNRRSRNDLLDELEDMGYIEVIKVVVDGQPTRGRRIYATSRA